MSDPPIEFFLFFFLAKRLTLCVFGAENKKNSMIANQSQKKKRKTTNKIIFKKEDDHPPFFVLFPNGKIQLKTQVLWFFDKSISLCRLDRTFDCVPKERKQKSIWHFLVNRRLETTSGEKTTDHIGPLIRHNLYIQKKKEKLVGRMGICFRCYWGSSCTYRKRALVLFFSLSNLTFNFFQL